MKLDLKDTTFVIPLLFDNPTRMRNLEICLMYLNKHLDTNILVVEQNGEHAKKLNDNNIEHHHLKLPLGHVHRSKLINTGVVESKTSIIAYNDCDVVLLPKQYEMAVEWIRQDKFDMVYPYSGMFLMLPDGFVNKFKATLDLTAAPRNHVMHPKSLGGTLYYRKEKFIQCGMENERISGWAYDDNERYARFTKLGNRINRVNGPLFHMNHPPADNNLGSPVNQSNHREFKRISNLPKDKLIEEIKTWSWVLNANIKMV